ncbi:MAG: LysR family transcriptional regulator substrate-binding protein [Clostridium fessum]
MPDIRQFLQANATLENKIQAVREQQEESIRVAAYASIAMYWMPEILYRFRRLCPKVDVDLRMVDHALEPFELLQSGKTDVIFASRQKEPKCEWIPLYHELLYAILPKQYPLNGRKEFPLREFEGKDFLMPYGRFDIDVHAAFAKEGVRAKEQSVYVDDETVIRMVGKGLGISMMSELMIRGNTEDVYWCSGFPDLHPGNRNGYEAGDGGEWEHCKAERMCDAVCEHVKQRRKRLFEITGITDQTVPALPFSQYRVYN